MDEPMSAMEANLCRAHNLINRTWMRLSDSFMWKIAEAREVGEFPDLSEEGAARIASQSLSELQQLDAIDVARLPHELALTLKVIRFRLEVDAQAHTRYWLAQTYSWVPAMFPVGPYGGGYLFSSALKVFTTFSFTFSSDADRYLALLEGYAHLIAQMHQRLLGQAARGIRIPRPALLNMRTLIQAQGEAACLALRVSRARLAGSAISSDFPDLVARRIEERVAPCYHALQDLIGTDYAAAAPEGVGIGQFDGGAGIYERLIAEHLSMRMSAEAVHRTGQERMRELETQMAQVRAAAGHPDRAEFHQYLHSDSAWVAGTVDRLQGYFDEAIRRIEPAIDRLFRFKPLARYRTERLDPKLEASMTAGYYQPPMPTHPDGVYYFNASSLSERSLAGASSLIYHELIPGHHFHVASQRENPLLHPIRQQLLFNAFNEGWAEYAATLAGEIGLYADPCEHYGRLLKDAYYTCRLVVDTGMNALGWSLDQARQYLRAHTDLSEREIVSETLRYATDIPGQSLAYKLGEMKMRQVRDRAQLALSDRFDIRDFHDVVLGAGALPLDVLDWHVDAWLEERG